MPRHVLQPLPRAYKGHGEGSSRRHGMLHGDGVWDRMDRCQVLGGPEGGHTGCVNALSWSDDGSILLSGSDDKRICIWTADPSASTSASPHPLKLSEVIATGHRANIFSAKFLPNTSTPTIVSCAGDRDVRVMEVERLGRSEHTIRTRRELYGADGPGTRILRCHTDRTKRIATENSPFLFLTVSEDGTVRQHDLRRPHACRSECPEPLFQGPRNIDLYSLSVSTVTPHIFAVAGRTDNAFICDRRMTQSQSQSWGSRTESAGQVHCVRRLGLTDDLWTEVSGGRARYYGEDRHITSVKMSPHNADEVICAFAGHSTAIFSTYDSPHSPSMRRASMSPTLTTSPSQPKIRADSPLGSAPHIQLASAAQKPNAKRRQSELSTLNQNTAPLARQRTSEPDIGPDHDLYHDLDHDLDHDLGPDAGHVTEAQMNESLPAHSSLNQDLVDQIIRDAQIMGDVPTRRALGPERNMMASGIAALESESLGSSLAASQPLPDNQLGAEELAHLRAMIEGEDDDDIDLDDDDLGEEMDLDDFMADDDGFYDEGEEDDDEFNDMPNEPRPFRGVDMIAPRRCFRGAKNMETVKDCNFLGDRSDKVCSGSDDGNFFVWDKNTGKLEGIWEGDGSVVNVMEQHPTLPLVAVSGIDNTVKMFSPMVQRPHPSFARLQLSESIIRANLDRRHYQPASHFGRVSLMDFMASRGIRPRFVYSDSDEEDEEETGEPQCPTQ